MPFSTQAVPSRLFLFLVLPNLNFLPEYYGNKCSIFATSTLSFLCWLLHTCLATSSVSSLLPPCLSSFPLPSVLGPLAHLYCPVTPKQLFLCFSFLSLVLLHFFFLHLVTRRASPCTAAACTVPILSTSVPLSSQTPVRSFLTSSLAGSDHRSFPKEDRDIPDST